jgi:hypothetical protein
MSRLYRPSEWGRWAVPHFRPQGGPAQSALYPVRIIIGLPPNRAVLDLNFARITSGPLKRSGVLCLLGRDLLQHVLLVYDGANGRFTIAF